MAPRRSFKTCATGQIACLENLRFHPEEEKNDEVFARELAKLADCYVNDAFGAAHRAHASVAALPRLFRDRAAGLLLEAELASLGRIVGNPSGRSSRSWAARRSPTRSASSRPSSPRSIS
jgi:phosphoglycerate kinase